MLLILLVSSLLSMSLYKINHSNEELQNKIEVKSNKAILANRLQNISNTRSALIIKILHTSNDFDRDDLIQEFYQNGQKFLIIREEFNRAAPDNYEKEFLRNHNQLINSVTEAQHNVINLRINEDYSEANHYFMSNALPRQQENSRRFNQLSIYQNKQIKLITTSLIKQQNETFYFILFSGIGIIIFCFFIAFFSYKKLTYNITETEKAHKDLSNSLLEQENLLYALNQHAIVSISNIDGDITYANDKFIEVSQYTEKELIGKKHNIVNSGHHKKAFFRDMWATIISGTTWQGEVKNRKKDGCYYWVETTIVPFLDKNNLPYQFIAIRTEITDIKNTEDELEFSIERISLEANKELETNELKGSFISTMTHELRSPMNSILGFSQLLLLEKDSLSSTQLDDISNINNSGNILLKSIDNIILYSKLQNHSINLEYGETNIKTLVQSVINELAIIYSKEEIEPTIETNIELHIKIDVNLLRKAIFHIIDNAIKFTKKGTININFKEFKKNDSLPANYRKSNKDLLLIRIIDTGIGITPEKLQLVFDEFRQVDEKDNREFGGFGIGLSLAKKIINLHNGEIWITSEIDQGTTVYITIPIS